MSDSELSIAFKSEQPAAQTGPANSAGIYVTEGPKSTPGVDDARTPAFHVEPQGEHVSPPQWAVDANDSVTFQLESVGTQSLEFTSAPQSGARGVPSPQAGVTSTTGAGPVRDPIDFRIEPTNPQQSKLESHGKNDSVVFQISSAPPTSSSPETHNIVVQPVEAEKCDDEELSTNDAASNNADKAHRSDFTAPPETEEVASVPSPELSTPRNREVPPAAAPMSNAQPTSHGTSSVQFLSVQSSAQEAPLQPATATTRAAVAANGDADHAPAPPAHLSRRAEMLARERVATPRSTKAPPKAPRTRSAGSSWVPRRDRTPTSTSTSATSSPPPAATTEPTAAARPPLAPSSGTPAAAPAPVAQPSRYARAQSADSEFSAFDNGSNSELASVPRSERGQAPPGVAPMQEIIVTEHTVRVAGAQWAGILKASPDAVERALVSDTANAADVETAFINVMRVAADEDDQPGLSATVKVAHNAAQSADVVDTRLAHCAFTETHLLYSLSTGEQEPVTRGVGRVPSIAGEDGHKEKEETPTQVPASQDRALAGAAAQSQSDADDGLVFQEEPAPVAPEEQAGAGTPQRAKKARKSKSKKAASKSRSPSKSPKKSKESKKTTPAESNKKGKATSTARAKSLKTPAKRDTSRSAAWKPSESCAPAYTPYQERPLPLELSTPRTYTPRTPRPGAGDDGSLRMSTRGPHTFTDASTTRRASSVGSHSTPSRPMVGAGPAASVPPQTVQRAVRPVTPRSAYRSQARPLLDASGNPTAASRLAPPARTSTSAAAPRHPSAQPREHAPEQVREDQAVMAEIHARQLLQQLRVHNESVQRSQARAARDAESQPSVQRHGTQHASTDAESPHDPNSPACRRETHSVSRRSHSRNQSPTRTGGRSNSPGASPLPRTTAYSVEDSDGAILVA